MSSSSKWPVPSLIALAPPPPPFSFSLELQQMVEICSRPPAMGECVCSSFVLLHDGAWLTAHTRDTPAVTSSLMSSLSRCHVFSLINDYEALMQSQANSLIWLKSRVHVCPSAESQKLLQESKMASKEYSLWTEQVAPCCLLWIWLNVFQILILIKPTHFLLLGDWFCFNPFLFLCMSVVYFQLKSTSHGREKAQDTFTPWAEAIEI